MAERQRAAHVIDLLQSRFRENVRIAPVFFEDRDTSGGRSDSMTLGVSHAEGERLVLGRVLAVMNSG